MKNRPSAALSLTPSRPHSPAAEEEEVERSSDERSKLEAIIGLRRERSLTAATRVCETGQRKMTNTASAAWCSAHPNFRHSVNINSSPPSSHQQQQRPLMTDPVRSCSGKKKTSSKRRCLLAYVLLLLSLAGQCCSSQRIVYRRTPWIRSRTAPDIPTFRGGPTRKDNESFYFVKMTYLERWGSTEDILLIGAKNRVYMLDAHPSALSAVQYREKLIFPVDPRLADFCKKSRTDRECKNDIREMYLMKSGKLKVCGTNAKKPVCRFYKREEFDGNQSVDQRNCRLLSGCICGSGGMKSVSIRVQGADGEEPQFFAAGYDDGFNLRDPVLTRVDDYIRTTSQQFESPDFVKILEYGQKIFLFFLENAKDSEVGISESQIKFGRVAQVCKNDTLNNFFSTFVKARLYCNVQQGRGPSMVYDVLTSVSDVVQVVLQEGESPVDVVFATFTTPGEWDLVKPTSAVCMYTMDEINTIFNQGDFFKEVSSETGKMYHTPIQQPGDGPRLSTCNYGTGKIQTDTITWAKDNFVMMNAVKPKFDSAIFVSEDNVRINSIKVDTRAGFGESMMLYLGTENGLILRVKPRFTENYPTSVFMEEMNFADGLECKESANCQVKTVAVTRRNSTVQPRLVVAFTDRIVFSNLATCSLHINRTICEADPECGYDKGRCVQRTHDNREFLGAVRTIEGDVDVINKTAALPSTAGISSKVIFFFLGLVIGLLATLVFVIIQRRKNAKKENTTSYSPSKVSLHAVHRRPSNGGVNNPPEAQPQDQQPTDSVVVSFAEDPLASSNSPPPPPTLDLRSGGSDQHSLIQPNNQNNQNNLNLIDEIMPAVKSIEEDFSRDRDHVEDKPAPESSPLIPEVAPKLPPKRKHLEAAQAASIANSNSNNNNNNNNSNNNTEFPRPAYTPPVETTDTLLLINQSLSRPPPIRPKMGVSRFHSFRHEQAPRVKPKIAPKPVLRSKSFQTRPTFSTSDLHPVSTASNSPNQHDSRTRLLD